MYNHAPDGYQCPLCAIMGEQTPVGPLFSPDDLVYADGTVYAMISAYQWPRNPGNVVIVPVPHFENIYDLPVEIACRVHAIAQAIALAMKAAWRCDGVSTRQHNEPAGNQDVWHYHLHVTPRFHGDNLYATYAAGKSVMPAEKRAKYARDLRDHMQA